MLKKCRASSDMGDYVGGIFPGGHNVESTSTTFKFVTILNVKSTFSKHWKLVNKTPKVILWYEPPKLHLSKTLYKRYITIKDFVMEKLNQKLFSLVNVDSTLL